MKRAILAALFVFVVLGAEAQTPTGSVSIAWDPAPASPDYTISGYKVCYGTTPASYPNCDSVGPVTQTVLGGLQDCTTYYVAVKALCSTCAAGKQESAGWSNEVSGWAAPRITGIVPASTQAGRPTPVTISGAGFGPGVALQVQGGTVANVVATNCGQMTAMVTVPTAGTPVVTVTQSGVVGRASGMFQVTPAIGPPNVSGVRRAEQ
jgi:hypothetical protein